MGLQSSEIKEVRNKKISIKDPNQPKIPLKCPTLDVSFPSSSRCFLICNYTTENGHLTRKLNIFLIIIQCV